MARICQNDKIEEIQLIPSSLNLDSDETEVKTVLSSENKGELSTIVTTPLPPGKEYHLFMSYSSEDSDDANTLRQHLEERFHLKCLYYERDFQIGKNIDESITEGLRKSVKALLLLSPFYIQSHWCVTEAREACKLSFDDMENHNVIPVLLRHLPKELPPFLNSYVYIDAQREMDVAGKINKAFNQPGYLDPLQMDKSALSCNGTLLIRKRATKAVFYNHGLAYRFLPLEAFEEEKICQNGIDLVGCKKHFTSIMEDLNNKCLFQNYPVFSSIKWRCLLLFVLSTAFGCIWMASFLLSATYGSTLKPNWIINMMIGLPLLFCICPFGLLLIYICRRRLSKGIHSVVLRNNLRFYRSSKCLVYFDQPTLTEPTLHVFKYNLDDCEDYLLSLLKRLRQNDLLWDTRTIKVIVKKLIHQKLEEFQSTQALIKWTLLRESSVNRHRTSNNRACICEMLEDHVNKTYGSVVIQV